MATDALILDLDRSLLPLPDSTCLDLGDWQEEIRFGCRLSSLQRLGTAIAPALAQSPDVVFMGSGDYHHLTCLLLERYRQAGRPIQLVVFDNHPDNMRYPFGIHCGSWVWHASRLPIVARVHVLGITSRDVEAGHAWENHLRNLRSGRVRYWCIGRDLGWMPRLGIRHSRSFPDTAAMLSAFMENLASTDDPIHCSIDKDVLSPDDAHTNWDQGVLRLDELLAALGRMRGRIVGADVVGEVSAYRYRSRFKRLLSGLDGQPEVPRPMLAHWQEQHRAINLRLLDVLRRK